MIDQAVFVIDPSSIFPLQVSGQGFGLSNPFHAAIALNILYELVNAFDCFLVLDLPVEVVFLGIVRLDFFSLIFHLDQFVCSALALA